MLYLISVERLKDRSNNLWLNSGSCAAQKLFNCVAPAKTQIIVFRLSFLDQLNNVYGSSLSFWL